MKFSHNFEANNVSLCVEIVIGLLFVICLVLFDCLVIICSLNNYLFSKEFSCGVNISESPRIVFRNSEKTSLWLYFLDQRNMQKRNLLRDVSYNEEMS